MVDGGRMRPGHWLGSVLCVYTQFGDGKDIEPLKILFHLLTKVLFWKERRKTTKEEQATPGKQPLNETWQW